MAWYAYWKWCRWWRKKPLYNWIEWYKEEIKTPEQRVEEKVKRTQAKQSLAIAYAMATSMPQYRRSEYDE